MVHEVLHESTDVISHLNTAFLKKGIKVKSFSIKLFQTFDLTPLTVVWHRLFFFFSMSGNRLLAFSLPSEPTKLSSRPDRFEMLHSSKSRRLEACYIGADANVC